MSATIQVTHRPAEVGTTTEHRIDRRALAVAALLVGAPVLRMISIVIHPLDTDDAAATLAHIDDVAARWAFAHLLEPVATMLLGVAAVLLLRLVPGAGRRMAQVGAVLFAMGSFGLALLVHAHGEAYLHMAHESVDQSQMTDLYARFHEGVPLAAPLIPLFVLGGIFLAVGLYQSGNVSRIAAVVFGVSTIIPNAIPQEDSLVLAGILGSAPMIAAMAVFAAAIVRRSRTPRRLPVAS